MRGTDRSYSISGFDSVIFDCDSTLTKIEGIDELAALKNVRDEISRITDAAMDGQLDFQTALERRLDLIRPTKTELFLIGHQYIAKVVDGAVEVIDVLRKSGKEVYILSGGFVESIKIFSEFLGIQFDHIFGNEIYFDSAGNYQGFNKSLAVGRSGGKAEIVRNIPGRKVMIGDGASDLETKNEVDLFIGFCGVKRRPIVEKEADVVVYEQSLTPVLPLIMNSQQRTKMSPHIKINEIIPK